MTRQPDPFAAAEHTAGGWLSAVAAQLDTDDRHHAYRVLRAWLHTVRDRLTVDAAAHLAAQLPELLRGVYYEGWTPSRVPMRFGTTEFAERFAHDAGISSDDAIRAAVAVSTAMGRLFSPGQLDHALAQLPEPLRTLLTAGEDGPAAGTTRGARLDRLERSVELLTEAVAELARGLEANPLDEPDSGRGAKAARMVHQLLLTSTPAE
jgi:uncharacterized protein (DUF2267 family)